MARPSKYPDELMERAVRLVIESGRPIAPVARDLGIHPEARSRLRTAVNSRGVLSERRRRFPHVLADDEGGLRRETHRTASVSSSLIKVGDVRPAR